MTTTPDPDRLIRAFLAEGQTDLPDRTYAAVRADIDRTRQRVVIGPWSEPRMNDIARLAIAAAALVVVAVVGTNLPAIRGIVGGGPAASPSPSPAPMTTPTPTLPSFLEVGFIGLPPQGATPSTPRSGELVDSYPVHGGGRPFEGMVLLYADGRLIWYMFYDGPRGPNTESTGFLEQRLTPDGVELVRIQSSLVEKDPLRLAEWLPPNAWEGKQIRPYVPSSYAACLQLFDPAAPVEQRVYPGSGPPMERSQMLALLPAAVADLLRDRETLPPTDDPPDCLAFTTEDARLLDAALADAGLAQDEQQNRYRLEYHLDAPGPGTSLITITFEPRFPDGTFICSACG